MADDNVFILNRGLEQRTRASGKQRVTIVVKSEPLAINLDPKALGAPVAAAIVHHFRERVKGIAAVAAPATLKAREVAAKAFAAGKPWALKRFSGGRIGAKPPNQSDRAYNDSGRFADSITGNASSDGSWRINVASNRLTSTMTGGIERVWNRLLELVPEFGDPAKLLANDIIRKSIEKSVENMIKVGKATTNANVATLVRQALALGRQLVGLGDALTGA